MALILDVLDDLATNISDDAFSWYEDSDDDGLIDDDWLGLNDRTLRAARDAALREVGQAEQSGRMDLRMATQFRAVIEQSFKDRDLQSLRASERQARDYARGEQVNGDAVVTDLPDDGRGLASSGVLEFTLDETADELADTTRDLLDRVGAGVARATPWWVPVVIIGGVLVWRRVR